MEVIPGSPLGVYVGLHKLAGELALEHLTGMKMSRYYSPLAYLRSIEINGQVCPFATKLAAMVWLVDLLGEAPTNRNILKVLTANAKRRDVAKLVKRFDLDLSNLEAL